MSNIILPDGSDPNTGISNVPINMGDVYNDPNAMPPKLASEHKAKNSDQSVNTYTGSQIAYLPDAWVKTAQAMSTPGVNNMQAAPMFFSPLHTPQNWQVASRRREIIQWARFFNENETKVAAAIQLYSQFPLNSFKLTCPSRKVLKFFEHKVVKPLKLIEKLKMMAFEYFVIGDVFTHLDIACDHCGGKGIDPNTGETCNHPGGLVKKIVILNPDWVEVQQSPLSDEPVMVLIPDEELKRIVFYKQPKTIYDRIPDEIKVLILQGKPIPLSSRTTSHLKHLPSPYGTYGTSLIRRMFTTLAYKTKIMTANWIVAERLILPIRVIKLGSDQRPATQIDIVDVQQQIAATANDPNLTLITHNNFEMDWIGASAKILQVTQELEYIGKELLDGFMLNQALLNGEMAGTGGSASVGVETLIRRLEIVRTTFENWVEENLFKPIAQMQGFINEEESEEIGETVYLYPQLKWEDLQLRDKNPYYQLLSMLHDKQLISDQTMLEELGLNYDQEIERKRYESTQVGPAGGGLGAGGPGAMGGAGGLGGMGMGAEGPGGAPPGGPDMGAAGGAGGLGGDATGGAGGAPPAGTMGPMASGQKIMKKGKSGGEKDEQQPAAMVKVNLTKIEQKLAGALQELTDVMGIRKDFIRFQYPVQNPNGGKPYHFDFAMPTIKLGIEADGEIAHDSPKQLAHDKERDGLLAKRGWTILRFKDRVIEDAIQEVKREIADFIKKLSQKKKASNSTYEKGELKLYMKKNASLADVTNTHKESYYGE